MKTMNFQKMILLVLAATVWAGCSKQIVEQDAPAQVGGSGSVTTVQFTATLAAKDGVTKSVNASGVTTWAVNEQVAVYYKKSDDSYDTATATVTSVDASGNATITASLSDAKSGGAVKFVYPATLHDGAGGIDATASGLLTQHGTIADISANFDAATATDVLRAAGSSYITASGSVTLTNQLLIGKFIPKSGAAIDGITELTINDGTRTYTVTPSEGTFGSDGIYVAMLPVASTEIILMATTSSQNYGFGGKTVTLEQGKFYTNLAIPMLKAYDLTSASVSVGENAFIYQSSPSPTANTVTAGDGYTAILSNLNIEAKNNPGVSCSGNVTLTLSGSNTVSSSGNPAIQAGGDGTTLTIQGSGSLNANGGVSAAGIGSGGYDSCGNITISGGTVTATGGDSAAGIGSGHCGHFSSISITSGITFVKATMGSDAEAPIGRGDGDSYSGFVTIDRTADWSAGTATTNLNFTVSDTNFDNDTWTLTPITTP